MAAVDRNILIKIAISKLEGTRPKHWETDARELYDTVVKASHPDITPDTANAAWRDAMAYMRDNHKDDWDAYVKHQKRPQDANATPWEKVKLVKGQADGDSFTLTFEVDGETCVIECTDVQLLDPQFILRKLVMYTRKDVACPYTNKKQLEAWRRDVVIPWLKLDFFNHVERQTLAEQVDDLIREFCANTMAGESSPAVWLQLKRAILEHGIIYVPFAGLHEFVMRHAGNDPTKKTVKNALSRLGFNECKKGRRALRFHSISVNKLYENIDPSETGGGEVNPDRTDGAGTLAAGQAGILDELRQEERDGFEIESGDGPASPETPV